MVPMSPESPRFRAARLHAPGKPLVVEEIALPEPGDGEVAVDMAFAGVNPVDRYIAEGRVAPAAPADLAGAVEGLAPTVVFDALGGGFSAAAVEALSPFGRLVSFGVSAGPMAELNMQSLYRKGLTVHGYGGLIEPEDRMVAGRSAALAALADGRLRVALAERLPLERVNEAFVALVGRAVAGKIVLDLGSSGGA